MTSVGHDGQSESLGLLHCYTLSLHCTKKSDLGLQVRCRKLLDSASLCSRRHEHAHALPLRYTKYWAQVRNIDCMLAHKQRRVTCFGFGYVGQCTLRVLSLSGLGSSGSTRMATSRKTTESMLAVDLPLHLPVQSAEKCIGCCSVHLIGQYQLRSLGPPAAGEDIGGRGMRPDTGL